MSSPERTLRMILSTLTPNDEHLVCLASSAGTHVASESKARSSRGSGSQVVISQVAVGPPDSSALPRIASVDVSMAAAPRTHTSNVKGCPGPA